MFKITNCDLKRKKRKALEIYAIRLYRKIDEDFYHIGHSLKDLGKKLFAFSKMDVMTGAELVSQL